MTSLGQRPSIELFYGRPYVEQREIVLGHVQDEFIEASGLMPSAVENGYNQD